MTRIPPWLVLCFITWFQCPFSTAFGLKCKPNSSFPHPLHCGFYYLCGDDSERHHFECPQGLLYHEEKKACDWASNVKCNLSEKLESLKEDIRLLELVKKYGLDFPINITEEETSDPPILATILDLEDKCVNLKENKTIEDVEKLQKGYVSECGEALLPYLYHTLEELDEKYNLTELLENGESKYLVGLMEDKSTSDARFNKQSSVGEEEDGKIEKERDGEIAEDEQQEDDKRKLDGLKKGEEKEGKEQLFKYDQDKNSSYKEQNKTHRQQNEYELNTEKYYNKYNSTSNNSALNNNQTLEETYSTILSNIEKRQLAENKTTEDRNTTKLFHRTKLIIDSKDVNNSDNDSSVTDSVPFSVEDNSTRQENNTDNSTVKPFQYQPLFPLINTGQLQLDLLGYEDKISCTNETCSVDGQEDEDEHEKGDRETILAEDQPQERNTTTEEETKEEKHSAAADLEEEKNQQESSTDKPQERNNTQTEESKVKKQSTAADLEEKNDQKTSVKNQPREKTTTRTEEVTVGKHSLPEDHEGTKDQRTTIEEIPVKENDSQTKSTVTSENT